MGLPESPRTRFEHSRSSLTRYFVWTFLLVPWIFYLFLAYFAQTSPALVPASLLLSKRPLVIVAHPDDESLFFGPTVLRLAHNVGVERDLRVLVISSGDYRGKGRLREREMQEACKRLGAKECIVINQDPVKDDPKLWWKDEAVTPIVKSWVTDLEADAVITFDYRGISGHINHRSLGVAIADQAANDPEFPPTFLLSTVSNSFPPRKFMGILDLPLTSIKFMSRIPAAIFWGSRDLSSYNAANWASYESRGLFVNTWATWMQNVYAFWAHSSQRTWKRWLYVLFSRYMWFNEIVLVQKIV